MNDPAPWPARFKVPAASIAAPVLVMLAYLATNPRSWQFPVGFVVLFIAARLRQKLVVDRDGLAVTVLATRSVPWAQVRGFRPGSTFSGGVVIDCEAGPVRSIAPCAWWGGPASPAQIAELEALRPPD